MKHAGIRQAIAREAAIWRVGALPGLMVIALVIFLRVLGGLEFFERFAFDLMLRVRPAEPVDDRILVIGITEADIRAIGQYPIPDQALADLIQTVQRNQPAAIGLDIFRDLAVEPGHDALVQVYQTTPELVAIDKAFAAEPGETVAPPPGLPASQVGFADAVFDTDGYLRRSLLGASTPEGDYRLSFTLKLAQRYLEGQGWPLENGIRNPNAMRFGRTELPQFQPYDGGYVRADASGYQVLINFRSGASPFRIVSMQQVLSGQVAAEWMRDRIVLIGVTAPSIKDTVSSAAIQGINPGLVTGIEVQAHAISQIVSAVLDQRPLIRVGSDVVDYSWIIIWGILGISLGRFFRSPINILIGLGVAGVILIGVSYGLLLVGIWVPVLPAVLVLFLNATGLTASLFYRREQDLQARIRERQLTLEQTFDSIHNGPLQTLAAILRQVRSELPHNPLQSDLEQLNWELRTVYESLRQEALTTGNRFYLRADLQLDLDQPLHEVLYEVFNHTLTREFAGFKGIKIKFPVFEPMDSQFLTVEQKRGLCRFLEEALCNVGKHTTDATQLHVICKSEHNQSLIRVIDNGQSQAPATTVHSSGGRGTQQAQALARQLGGKFRRVPAAPRGTLCELSWPISQPWFWRLR